MAHVGIERLRAGHDQEHGAEHGEADPAVMQKEREAEPRIEGAQHMRRVADVRRAQRADHDEEERHHRSEQRRDPRRAMALRPEQRNEDDERDRKHELAESGIDDGEAFDGG